jgi:Peroxisome biogenesis factor 1, N-terminal
MTVCDSEEFNRNECAISRAFEKYEIAPKLGSQNISKRRDSRRFPSHVAMELRVAFKASQDACASLPARLLDRVVEAFDQLASSSSSSSSSSPAVNRTTAALRISRNGTDAPAFVGWLGERSESGDSIGLHPLMAASLGLREGEKVRVAPVFTSGFSVRSDGGRGGAGSSALGDVGFRGGSAQLDELVADGANSVMVPAARVSLQPVGPSDWEIVEHQGVWLEAGFLNQVTVVFKGQVLPVWCQGSAVANFVVEDITSVGGAMRIAQAARSGVRDAAADDEVLFDCASLNADMCDVVIAPRLRQQQTDASRQNPAVDALQPGAESPPVTLRFMEPLEDTGERAAKVVEVLVSPFTARQHGWSAGDTLLIRQLPAESAAFASLGDELTSVRRARDALLAGVAQSLERATGVVLLPVRVTAAVDDRPIPDGHLLVTSSVAFSHYHFRAFDRVRAHKVRGGFPEQTVQNVCLVPLLDQNEYPPYIGVPDVECEPDASAEQRRDVTDARDEVFRTSLHALFESPQPRFDGEMVFLDLPSSVLGGDRQQRETAYPFAMFFGDYARLVRATSHDDPTVDPNQLPYHPHLSGVKIFMAADTSAFRDSFQLLPSTLAPDFEFLPAFVARVSPDPLVLATATVDPRVRQPREASWIAECRRRDVPALFSRTADASSAGQLGEVVREVLRHTSATFSRASVTQRLLLFQPSSERSALENRCSLGGGLCLYGGEGVGTTTTALSLLRHLAVPTGAAGGVPVTSFGIRCADGWKEARAEVRFLECLYSQ